MEMIQRLNSAAGIQIAEDAAERRPSFPMGTLRNDAAVKAFEECMEWAIGLVQCGN
ncbi:MAG: hypothetical protein HY821_05340 [Acidobacteria bacterium]|nr:hypothetical protein [Acidobacteriota bacterium]